MILFHKCLKWYCLSLEETVDYKNTASDNQLIKFWALRFIWQKKIKVVYTYEIRLNFEAVWNLGEKIHFCIKITVLSMLLQEEDSKIYANI